MPNCPMDKMSDRPDITLEVTALYLGMMEVLAGASLPAVRSALAMTMLMAGENAGLTGDDLVDWIDQTGNEARVALGRQPHPRH
jgi:hypothetical protein